MKTGKKCAALKPRPIGKEKPVSADSGAGFTLLEVLVSLVILAIGATAVMAAISGSLGNVRKVQLRTRVMAYAENIMEASLYAENLQQPTTYAQDLEDGFHCVVQVEEYEPELGIESDTELTIKLLQYTVEMTGPDSPAPIYTIHTLKLVDTSEESQSSATR